MAKKEEQYTTEDSYLKEVWRQYPADILMLQTLANLTGKSLAEVVGAFYDAKQRINKVIHGL